MPFSTATDPSPRKPSVVLNLVVPAATGEIAARTHAGIIGESKGATAFWDAPGQELRHPASRSASKQPETR